jgi:signal transduction histidine kinase
MRERIQAIGGQFTVQSAPGAGTRIHVQAAARARP